MNTIHYDTVRAFLAGVLSSKAARCPPPPGPSGGWGGIVVRELRSCPSALCCAGPTTNQRKPTQTNAKRDKVTQNNPKCVPTNVNPQEKVRRICRQAREAMFGVSGPIWREISENGPEEGTGVPQTQRKPTQNQHKPTQNENLVLCWFMLGLRSTQTNAKTSQSGAKQGKVRRNQHKLAGNSTAGLSAPAQGPVQL